MRRVNTPRSKQCRESQLPLVNDYGESSDNWEYLLEYGWNSVMKKRSKKSRWTVPLIYLHTHCHIVKFSRLSLSVYECINNLAFFRFQVSFLGCVLNSNSLVLLLSLATARQYRNLQDEVIANNKTRKAIT
jgi:hypothetical protein